MARPLFRQIWTAGASMTAEEFKLAFPRKKDHMISVFQDIKSLLTVFCGISSQHDCDNPYSNFFKGLD
ncbi:hypothetical protein SAY87_020773 [Trapa incisa]|uniref:Uncharacterized protein n=1 Tax=Trapa incisa TaxID=236973 RepID=A0AAN7JR26_9MYRT|nr:hypothetical protein SAY87_020773 [Trapa incisa]